LGLRLFSFGGYGLALAALALVVFGAIECPRKNVFANGETLTTFFHEFIVKWGQCNNATNH